mgnify:CR=1 FL=1
MGASDSMMNRGVTKPGLPQVVLHKRSNMSGGFGLYGPHAGSFPSCHNATVFPVLQSRCGL